MLLSYFIHQSNVSSFQSIKFSRSLLRTKIQLKGQHQSCLYSRVGILSSGRNPIVNIKLRNNPNISIQRIRSSPLSSTATLGEVPDETDMTAPTPSYPNFQDIRELHPVLKSNLNGLKLTTMTEIQAKTWEAASTGQDVLGRARTGTGKTVAFLLPSLQQLFIENANVPIIDQTKIQMLILSPTRELAAQIHDQGLKLTRTGNNIISHQVMFGGTSKTKDIEMLERRIPVVLVSTPGRIKDHIETTLIHDGKRSFKSLLSKVKILVLDETDR
jgi:superfamily II DNA/RNA helicase